MKNCKFKERLKALRLKENLSQTELADLIGISRQSIGFYEQGFRLPDVEIASDIADYFNVTTDYLLGKTDIKNADPDMQAICKYTGLNEEAINVLKFYHTRNVSNFISTVNFLLEQETPYPLNPAVVIPDNMSEEEWDKILAEEEKKWKAKKYVSVIGMICDFLTVRISEKTMFKVTPTELIQENRTNRFDFDNIARIDGKTLIYNVLLPEIQERLKKAKEKYNAEGKNNGEHNETDK